MTKVNPRIPVNVVNPMTQEEIIAWEETLHGMEIEEIAQLVWLCENYTRKFYGFDQTIKAERTPEWVAKASRRLEGQIEPCCECGEDYPRADLWLYGHVFCPNCREVQPDE